ncbi:hypothetical protein [Pseudoalteromonas galatheae]|uniref:hypothetical protein n=1 Tax=Pseudoalteromonas galatheae TaxID=579562 RepID=UPI0030D2792F
MDKDVYKKYNGRLSIRAIERASKELYEKAPKSSVISIRVLLDIVSHQGDSPANIGDRLVDNRDSTSVQNAIIKLEKMGWFKIHQTEYKNGPYPRKQVFLTSKLAELLELTSEQVIINQ